MLPQREALAAAMRARLQSYNGLASANAVQSAGRRGVRSREV
jgi:hypothetical protein